MSSNLPSPRLLKTVRELRQYIREQRQHKNFELCIALVPTMGALHEGHLELVRQARKLNGTSSGKQSPSSSPPTLVVVSIFVNPLQFGPNEDFGRYPRTLAADLAMLGGGLADCVFAPAAEEILGQNGENPVRIHAGYIGSLLEGKSRPGHFDGVLTIVAKLFNIVQPDAALFGQKDAQQLFAIQQMTTSLNFPVHIVPVKTHRELDGLAMSSRNSYLSADQRMAALGLWRTLNRVKSETEKLGGRQLDQVLAEARENFGLECGNGNLLRLDYLVAVDAATFRPMEGEEMLAQFRGPARLLIAALVGNTRLIDNVELRIGCCENE